LAQARLYNRSNFLVCVLFIELCCVPAGRHVFGPAVIYRRVKAKDQPTVEPSIGIQQKLYGRKALITAAMTSTATSSGNVPFKIRDFKICLQVRQIKI